MQTEYDKYYLTNNLFGAPYPELIRYFSSIKNKGKLLDLGCGQGRDAIALARLGYDVVGIDNSIVGIEQLNQIANQNNLNLSGQVHDIYSYDNFKAFDFILLDSMFHFGKKELKKEIGLLKKIIAHSKPNAQIINCIQKTGKKIEIFNTLNTSFPEIEVIHREEIIYTFQDPSSTHSSSTTYEMIAIKR